MAEENEICPACHSKIAPEPLENRRQGEIEPGETVEITEGNETREVRTSTSGAIPQWTDDPGLNKRGTNGETFRGDMFCKAIHLKEIQDARKAEEVEVGLTDDQKTTFSPIESGSDYLLVRHLVELRESTEKIMNAAGTEAKDYFKLDIDETEHTLIPEYGTEKEEWTFVERGYPYVSSDGSIQTKFKLPDGTEKPSPTPPPGHIVNLLDLEELRHPLQIGWREYWSVSPEQSYTIMSVEASEKVCRTRELDESLDSVGIGQHEVLDDNTLNLITPVYHEETHTDAKSTENLRNSNLQLINEQHTHTETGTPGQPGYSKYDFDVFDHRGQAVETGFDIHPTNGGMQLGVYKLDPEDEKGERTWQIQASANKKEELRELMFLNHVPGPGRESFDPSNVESIGESTSEIKIEAGGYSDIVEKVPDANRLKLITYSEADITGSDNRNLASTPPAMFNTPVATARIGHAWGIDFTSATNLGFFVSPFTTTGVTKTEFLTEVDGFQNRIIPVKRYTRFLGTFTANFDLEGTAPVNISLPGGGSTGYDPENQLIPNASTSDGTPTANGIVVLRLTTQQPRPSNVSVIELRINFGHRPDDVISTSEDITEEDNDITFRVDTTESPSIARITWTRNFEKGTAKRYNVDIMMDRLLQRLEEEGVKETPSSQFFQYEPQYIDNPDTSEGQPEEIPNPNNTTVFFTNIEIQTTSQILTTANSVNNKSSGFASTELWVEGLRIINSKRPE